VLTLATESLDMMRSVTGIFKESLDRAEVWVERLRVIGVQRQPTEEGTSLRLPRINDTGSETDGPGTSPLDTPASGLAYSPISRSYFADAPSPAGLATMSLDGLSLSSTYATPRSSTSSLPTLADYSWDYTAAGVAGSSGKEDKEDEVSVQHIERAAVSAVRGTALDPPISTMEVDRVL